MPAELPTGTPASPLNAGQVVILGLIRGYQLGFAPFYAGSCRFTPSCSTYAAEAVRRFGALRGARLALGRLLRCRPFGGHGLDPVPEPATPDLRRDPPAAVRQHSL